MNEYKNINLKKTKYSFRKSFPWAVKALERDGFKCTNCGTSDRKIIIHHIDESRKTGKLNNSLSNLLSLCKSCHSKVHGQTKEVNPKMIEMRKSGMTLQRIGDFFGISRERVRQILSKTDLV